MSSYSPPSYVVSIYNPAYYATSGSLTLATATGLFLNKNATDTATALETFTAGVATDIIQPVTSTDDLAIYPAQTSGNLYIGVDSLSSSGRSGTVHLADGNNAPSGANVHINNGTTNSSNTNIMNGANTFGSINMMTGSTSGGNINIGNGIGSSQTIKINIGSGTTISPIYIGNSANVTNITNPVLLPVYTTLPTFSAGQVGYTYSSFLSADFTVGATGGTNSIMTLSSLPVGVYYCQWGLILYNNSGSSSVSQILGFLSISPDQTVNSVVFPSIMGAQTVTNLTIGFPTVVQSNLSGSGIFTITGSTARTITLNAYIAYVTTTGTLIIKQTYRSTPATYILATRIA